MYCHILLLMKGSSSLPASQKKNGMKHSQTEIDNAKKTQPMNINEETANKVFKKHYDKDNMFQSISRAMQEYARDCVQDADVTIAKQNKLIEKLQESAIIGVCDIAQQNELIEKLKELICRKSKIAELRKKNEGLETLENMLADHQELTQWIEEQIDNEPGTIIFEISHDFLEILYNKVHKINH